MANNLPVREQISLARNFIRTRPGRVALLVLLVAIVPFVARKYEPIMVQYSAHLSNPDREIETLFIFNPNVEQRNVTLDLSPNGEVIDLGIDRSTAVDLSNRTSRLIRLTVAEQSSATISILRTQQEHASVKAASKSLEVVSADTIMRYVALTYLVSLMLFLKEAIGSFGAAIGLLSGVSSLTNLGEIKEKISKLFS
jgi:hypothetical protein